MAVLTNPSLLGQSTSPGTPRFAVLGFPKVTAGDTFDASTLAGQIQPFVVVYAAIFVATSNRTASPATATITGTVITMNGTGIANDTGYLFVEGE